MLISKYSDNKIRLIHVINDVISFKNLFDLGLKKYFCSNVAGLRRKWVIPSHDFQRSKGLGAGYPTHKPNNNSGSPQIISDVYSYAYVIRVGANTTTTTSTTLLTHAFPAGQPVRRPVSCVWIRGYELWCAPPTLCGSVGSVGMFSNFEEKSWALIVCSKDDTIILTFLL